jgi:hypothetical protein
MPTFGNRQAIPPVYSGRPGPVQPPTPSPDPAPTRPGRAWIGTALALALALGQAAMGADTYYVATNGNDSKAGTLASPWKTISRGVSDLNAGDTLYVRGGTYVETRGVNVTRSGNASAPITVAAYPGETPVIDGQNTYPTGKWGALVSLQGHYIHMSGFEVKNSNAATGSASRGVTLWGNHNTISKFNVHDIQGNGVLIQGDYGTVEDSEVWRVCMENENNKLNGWGSGLSAARGSAHSAIRNITSYPIIRRNKLHHAWGEGLSMYETLHGIVENNEVWDNYAVNMYISDATHTLVKNNIIYVTPNNGMLNGGGQREGLALSNEIANGTSIPYSTDNIIINNLFLNASASLFAWSLVPSQGFKNSVFAGNTIVNGHVAIHRTLFTHVNSVIANNIVTGVTNPVTDATNNGITWHNNLWPVTPPPAAAGPGDVINANAGVARSGGTGAGQLTSAYFGLISTSPAINKGATLSARTSDYYGQAFVGTPDMGAIEYGSTAALTSSRSTPSKTAVPKPQRQTAAPKPIAKPQAEALQRFTLQTRERALAAAKAGRGPIFTLKAMGSEACIEGGDDNDVNLRLGTSAISVAWRTLTTDDYAGIAMHLARSGDPADCALAAFWLRVTGRDEEARDLLLRAGIFASDVDAGFTR